MLTQITENLAQKFAATFVKRDHITLNATTSKMRCIIWCEFQTRRDLNFALEFV